MENLNRTINLRNSLAARFILIAAALVVIMQLLFAAFQINGEYQTNLDALTREVSNTTLLLSTVTTEAILTSDFLFLETLMQQANNAPDIVYSVVVDSTGKPITRFLDRTEPIIQDILDSGDVRALSDVFDAAAQNPAVRTVSLPVELEGETIGEVQVAYSTVRIQSELLGAILNTVIISLAMILGLTAGTFIVFEQTVRRPLQRLGELAHNLASGDLNRRVEVNRQDEIGQLGQAFNLMAVQLEELIEGLEQRVAERTRDLKVAAEVAREVSRVLDMKQLLPYLTNTTRNGFDLAHVSIFLYEDTTNTLRLAAGSGSVGRKMMEQGKQFLLEDKGLVPLAARTFEHQIINDVQASKDHFVNPLLPGTRSEATLPMRVGTRLIGVLDLQSNEVDHFSDEQIAVLTTLADQIAIAVQNAELFTNLQAARAEAEQASVVKSQFLASMSHELRTPLNAILNFAQFVSSGMLGEVNGEQVEMLDKVVHSGKHLLSLINDVLDISKIEAGALKLFIENDVDMAEEARSVLDAAVGLLADKPVKLVSEIESQLPTLTGDRRRIRQIMLNLVSNACKFTHEGEIRIVLNRDGDFVRFVVSDTGPGIAEEDKDLVFETFRQTESGLRQGEGTGLGLPISRRLAETHGGDISFESTVNVGTTFYFTLPIHNTELAALASKKEKHHVA